MPWAFTGRPVGAGEAWFVTRLLCVGGLGREGSSGGVSLLDSRPATPAAPFPRSPAGAGVGSLTGRLCFQTQFALDERFKLLSERIFWHQADHFVFDFTIFEEQEHRDRFDAELHSEVAVVVDVHLGDFHGVAELGSQFIKNRRKHFAWTAPFSPEVDKNRFVRRGDLGGKIASGDGDDGWVGHSNEMWGWKTDVCDPSGRLQTDVLRDQ